MNNEEKRTSGFVEALGRSNKALIKATIARLDKDGQKKKLTPQEKETIKKITRVVLGSPPTESIEKIILTKTEWYGSNQPSNYHVESEVIPPSLGSPFTAYKIELDPNLFNSNDICAGSRIPTDHPVLSSLVKLNSLVKAINNWSAE